MDRQRVTMTNASSIVDELFSLNEPWRSRFLDLIADWAAQDSGRQPPTRRQVASWLDDCGLYRDVARVLRTWSGL